MCCILVWMPACCLEATQADGRGPTAPRGSSPAASAAALPHALEELAAAKHQSPAPPWRPPAAGSWRPHTHLRMCPASASPSASRVVRLSQMALSTGAGRESARSNCGQRGPSTHPGLEPAGQGGIAGRIASMQQCREVAGPATAAQRMQPAAPLTTWAWPRLRKRTVRRRGPTRPPLLALMKTMRGVSATPGPTNGLAPTRYSAGILHPQVGAGPGSRGCRRSTCFPGGRRQQGSPRLQDERGLSPEAVQAVSGGPRPCRPLLGRPPPLLAPCCSAAAAAVLPDSLPVWFPHVRHLAILEILRVHLAAERGQTDAGTEHMRQKLYCAPMCGTKETDGARQGT